MDREERPRSVYGMVLQALEEALSWLERPPAGGPDVHDTQRSGMFHLGVAGGLAFSGHLPGIKSKALVDDISNAAEKRDLGQVGRIRRTVVDRLRSDRPPARAVSTGTPGSCRCVPSCKRRAGRGKRVTPSATPSWRGSSSASCQRGRGGGSDTGTVPSRTRCWLPTTEIRRAPEPG